MLSKQQLAKRMQIAAQYCQAEVAFKANLTTVTITLQSVASLKRPDRRLYPTMVQTRLVKLHSPFLQTLGILTRMTRQHTNVIDNLAERHFVFITIKTAVERGCFNLAAMLPLSDLRLIDHHILVSRIAIHQMIVTDEASTIFIDQYQTSVLVGLPCFATTVQLRVGFKETKQFVTVRDTFAQQHTPTSGIANLLCQLDPLLNGSRLRKNRRGRRFVSDGIYE